MVRYSYISVAITIAFICLLSVSASAQLDKANHYFEQGAYTNALEHYQKMLKKSPDKVAYLQNQIGECYLHMNKPEEALGWFTSAQKQGYNEPSILYSLGLASMAMANYDEALTYFKAYAEKKPDDKRTVAKIASCTFAKANKNPNATFALQPVYELNSTGSEYGVSYYRNQLIYSSAGANEMGKSQNISPRTGLGYSTLYISAQANDSTFAAGTKLKNIYSEKANRGVVSYDSLTNKLYCTSCRNGQKDCYISIIQIKGNSYKEVGRLEIGNTDYGIGHPYVTTDGKRLYFTSTMEGGFGGDDIWYCEKLANGKWSSPINAGPNVNTAGNEVFPYVKGQYLYFASDGHEGFGGLDLYVSSYGDNGYGKPFNLQRPFNSEYDDFNLILNESSSGGLMVSNRNNQQNSDNLYRFIGAPCIVVIDGKVYDKATRKPLQDVNIEVLNSMGEPLQKVVTDNDGHYQTFLQSGVDNRVSITATGYSSSEKHFDTKSTPCFTTLNTLNGYDTDIYLDVVAPPLTSSIIKYAVELKDIYYEFDLARITHQSKVELDKLVSLMSKYPQLNVQIAAHTDVRGSSKYNQELSDKRATEVSSYLQLQGIKAGRIEAKGYGETQLLIANARNEAEQQLNRRTIFTLYAVGQQADVQIDMLSTEKLLKQATPAQIAGYTKWWVQVAAIRQADMKTVETWEKLTGKSIEAIRGDDGWMHICIGPFESAQQAAPTAEQLNAKGIQTVVKEVNQAGNS